VGSPVAAGLDLNAKEYLLDLARIQRAPLYRAGITCDQDQPRQQAAPTAAPSHRRGHPQAASGGVGIDGIVKQDRLGLDVVDVQAKRLAEDWSVAAQAVRNCAGSLIVRKATKEASRWWMPSSWRT
jgi:hypothetical protein